jgi:hypothetical protein
VLGFSTTTLCEQPVPALAELARDPELEPVEITRAEFEAMWNQALDDDPSLAH